MKVNWKDLWDANPDLFIVSGWEECPEDKRRGLHLPSQFQYYNAGDLNLRAGIITAQGKYKEEDLLLAGMLWGGRIGNGVRTIIYFVAQQFTPVFLGAISELGGHLSAKAVYWREKLSPSLYPVTKKDTKSSSVNCLTELRPDWGHWERQLNPVARGHLKIVKEYLDGLSKRKVRLVLGKNRIVACWGSIEIVEIKIKGNKFELSTKVKWTRNRNISSKFLKSGWVDLSGKINEEFCRTLNDILEFLENMEANNSLVGKDILTLKLLFDKDFVPRFWGTPIELPWLNREKNDILESDQLYFFRGQDEVNVVYPILEKPINKLGSILLVSTALEHSSLRNKGLPECPDLKWNQKIYLLIPQNYMDELRLCLIWLKNRDKFPVVILPVDWKTEGFKNLNSYDRYEGY
ncbi:MAG: hypothetical protein APF84_02835 [Gracilibacter sp. BRH_c7a]|nr:MAG: hypothetical protein APF84_02835 [Gracilibacter sp. BRH_c7a]